MRIQCVLCEIRIIRIEYAHGSLLMKNKLSSPLHWTVRQSKLWNAWHLSDCLSTTIPHTFPEESIVVQIAVAAPHWQAAIRMTFIRGRLFANACKSLSKACIKPPWLVSQDDLYELGMVHSIQPNCRVSYWTLCGDMGQGKTQMEKV